MPFDITTTIALLTVLGGGVAWATKLYFDRTDKRRDRMIELLEKNVESAERERDEARAQVKAAEALAAERIAAAEREGDYWKGVALAWCSQMIKAGMDPEPPLDLGGAP